MEKAILSSNIRGSVWVGGKPELIEFSPHISRVSLCRDVDFSQQAERVPSSVWK